jgi:hypothetical protein
MLAALLLLLLVGVLAVGVSNSWQSNTASLNGAGFQSAANSSETGGGVSSDAPYPPQGRDIDLGNGGIVREAAKHDVSPPLRDIPIKRPGPIAQREREREALPEYPSRNLIEDPVLQSVFGPVAMPTPLANFEGIYNYWGAIPPDTVGDVGPNHYVQMVNVGFQIYNKSGTSLYGPANFNTLFTGFGGLCETRNDGDPVVVYDQLADRWVLTQFTAPPGPYFECIAVSATGDPTGAYYRYAFQVSAANFEDYPHFGVWPNAYYMASNEFANGTASVGAGFFAFERAKMISGQTARMIYFNRPLPYGGFLPSDMDGYTLPPAGSPNFFMAPNRVAGNAIRLVKFQITTWDPAPVAALTDAPDIPVQTFDTTAGTVPQPGTGIGLDSITDRFMYRLAYRNFGTHETLVVNHTVDAGSNRAGVRWYEIRNPNAVAPTVHQQGTYAPADGLYRWMGSIAMDGTGNIAVGYSVSSSTVFPSIRYAGRVVSDTLGLLPQAEASIIAGGGSQTETIAGRWGDYSSMNVDVDDCTFWYTTEYYPVTALRSWHTRIGSFKFPNCTPVVGPTATATTTGTPPTAVPTSTRTSTALPSATPCAAGISATGVLTNTDPVQTGRLGRSAAISSCAVPKACPAAGDTLVRHYDSYTLTNNSGASQCVTVRVVNHCGNNSLLSAAYLGSFDPNNICTNYLADMGLSGPDFTYSFNVPAGATYVVTVLENSPNIGCDSYDISVNPCSVSGGPTATVTSTPLISTPIPTSTRTATLVVATQTPGGPSATIAATGTSTSTLVPASATTTRTATIVPTQTVVVPTATTTAQATGTTTATRVASATNTALISTPTITIIAPSATRTPTIALTQTPVGATATLIPTGTNTVVVPTGTNTVIVPTSTVTAVLPTQTPGGATATLIPTGTNTVSVPSATITQVANTATPTLTTAPTQTPGGSTATTEPSQTPVPPTSTTTTTATAIPSATSTPCTVSFTDVQPDNVFYTFIRCLACRGIVSGYADGTFRPFNDITRGQIAKVVSNSAGFDEDPGPQIYEDVDANNPFYQWINRLSMRGHMGGYPCGTVDVEPCIGPDNRPYFRPFANATRGQLAKIVANAAGIGGTPTGVFYTDVQEDNPFYVWIMRLTDLSVMSGYDCGGPGEPCDDQNRPYFRPFNNVTRGQASKIVANTFFPNCETPTRR